ncbi:GntR family transcriptional regulator [Amycolatopsis sp. TRM77291]
MSVFEDIELNRRSTAEQVADGLAEKIVRGELRPGERIRESVIATTLGVSRNTIREAMRLLERSSLITYTFNRGAVVKQPSSIELQEVYHARRVLEVAGVSTPEPTAAAMTRLDEAFQRLTEASHQGTPADLVASDLAFHAALVGLAGSSRVDQYFAELTQELTFYLMIITVRDHEYEQPEGLIDEHRAILDAVKDANPGAAGVLVGEHIDRNARRVEQLLDAQAP